MSITTNNLAIKNSLNEIKVAKNAINIVLIAEKREITKNGSSL
jgi:hypothetical protein